MHTDSSSIYSVKCNVTKCSHTVPVTTVIRNTLGSVLSNNSHQSCSAALCPDPVGIVNGMVTFTGNSVGDTATYACDPGFELIGPATATCTAVDANSAAFSPPPPVCRREYTALINSLEWLRSRKAIDEYNLLVHVHTVFSIYEHSCLQAHSVYAIHYTWGV